MPSLKAAPDPLDSRSLPDEHEERCELNERLVPTSSAGRKALTQSAVRSICVLSLSAAAFPLASRVVAGSGAPPFSLFLQGTAVVFLGLAAIQFLFASVGSEYYLRQAASVFLLAALLWAAEHMPNARAGYCLLAPAALIAAIALNHFVAKQYVFYAAANLKNDWWTSTAWRGHWQELETRVAAAAFRPEVMAYRRAVRLLVPAYLVGLFAPSYGLFIYALGLVLVAVRVWPTGTSPRGALLASLYALRVILTYDRAELKAPGVFRFPTKELRPWAARIAILFSVLVLLSTTVSTAIPLRQPARAAIVVQPAGEMPRMTAEEGEYFGSLSHFEDREAYLQLLRDRRAGEAEIGRRTEVAHERTLLVTAVRCLVLPVVLLLLTLVVVAGPLLSACHNALEAE